MALIKAIWTITNEDAEKVITFLQPCALEYIKAGEIEPDIVQAIENVRAALMWADRIEIED